MLSRTYFYLTDTTHLVFKTSYYETFKDCNMKLYSVLENLLTNSRTDRTPTRLYVSTPYNSLQNRIKLIKII